MGETKDEFIAGLVSQIKAATQAFRWPRVVRRDGKRFGRGIVLKTKRDIKDYLKLWGNPSGPIFTEGAIIYTWDSGK